jgi:ligand-binding sensor domain-containing protein
MTTLSTRDGSVWVGTFDHGLNRMLPGQPPDSNSGLRSNMVLSLYEPRQRRLGRDGEGTTAHHQWDDWLRLVSLSGEAVGVILEDRNGAIWAGTQDGGLNRIMGGGSLFTRADSLRAISFSLCTRTPRRALDRNRRRRTSRFRMDAGRPSPREGLYDSVFTILEDNNGYLWMAATGIFRVSRRLSTITRRAAAEGDERRLRRIDGMQSRECNGGTQPAAWKTGTKLWFATARAWS